MSGPRQISFANVKDGQHAPGATVVQFGESVEEEPDAYAPPAPRRAVQRKPAPKNIVALAKARLREVKTELKRMKALEKERLELERLIQAAEGRQVKSAAGKVVGISKAAG